MSRTMLKVLKEEHDYTVFAANHSSLQAAVASAAGDMERAESLWTIADRRTATAAVLRDRLAQVDPSFSAGA